MMVTRWRGGGGRQGRVLMGGGGLAREMCRGVHPSLLYTQLINPMAISCPQKGIIPNYERRNFDFWIGKLSEDF